MHTKPTKDPRPKSTFKWPSRVTYPIENVVLLPKVNVAKADMFSVLKRRHSSKDLGKPTLNQMAQFLGHAARTYAARMELTGQMWQHRASPSAGGIHPIDIFLLNLSPDEEAVYFYDPLSHALKKIGTPVAKKLRGLRSNAFSVKNESDAAIIWFGAQTHLTSAKYNNYESLIWLDSGCLMMTCYMVATALRLRCCALGTTGDKYFSELRHGSVSMRGIGGLLVGK